MNKRIVMLCSYCFSTVALYNYLSRYYTVEKVITEDPMRGMALAKRRLKKLGLWKVAGQVLFGIIIVPLLRLSGKKRITAIKRQYAFDESPVPAGKLIHFPSVNDERCMAYLKEIKPDIIVVNGTRIISRTLLESTNAVLINMHTGITPKYRGVHGGYWAVAKNDEEHCGVTIHQVDKGIDTGDVLYQSLITVTAKDNFVTYPYLQFGEGMPLMKEAISDIMNNHLTPVKPMTTESRLWYHPTIWQYGWYRLSGGKK